MSLARRAGLTPGRREFFTFHVHAHLDIFVNGRPVRIPAGIGINIADPQVHRGKVAGAASYGSIKLCATPCISPLHTHDITGVIHIETRTSVLFTLGQFFTEWGVRLDASCVGGYCAPDARIAVFADGKRRRGNPAAIGLTSHQEIVLIVGSPPGSIPSSCAFGPGE
jgi:hypothetical protein